MKDQYFSKFNENLSPHMFHLDCEIATILSIQHNFPESPITLCSVHILRNMLKKLKEYTFGNFFMNKTLLKFWKTLSGSFFFNLSNPEILNNILSYFRTDILAELAQWKSFKFHRKIFSLSIISILLHSLTSLKGVGKAN